MERLVCWFSCGAASAVATKLAISGNAGRLPLVIAYTEIKEEHPDNKRFLAECETWFGQKIVILKNEKYNGSIYEVFKHVKFLKSPYGAPFTRLLKKDVRKKFQQPNDIQVFGYTVEEEHRANLFIDANNEVQLMTPLIDRGLSKDDCLAMVIDAGIDLPAMYKLGYHNNNCIGCVKGAKGYWNKIRTDFPLQFDRMSEIEEILGAAINSDDKKVDGKNIKTLIPLRELPESAGNYPSEPDISCGIFCHMAKQDYAV